jgi:hypothetical protein
VARINSFSHRESILYLCAILVSCLLLHSIPIDIPCAQVHERLPGLERRPLGAPSCAT